MAGMYVCRLLMDPPAEGAWNMALDEALLESAATGSQATWRFYGWSRPTLSLGRFQACGDRTRHVPSRECDLVRRASGGGAILHDRELTYSLAIPAAHRWAGDVAGLYRRVHFALLDVLSLKGVTARLWEDNPGCGMSGRPAAGEPFWCFQRRGAADVIVGASKVAGSAQRRPAGAILQHGSVLVAQSAHAPELPGLAELTGEAWGLEWLIAAWLGVLEGRLGWSFRRGEIERGERFRAETLVDKKYARPEWTARL